MCDVVFCWLLDDCVCAILAGVGVVVCVEAVFDGVACSFGLAVDVGCVGVLVGGAVGSFWYM